LQLSTCSVVGADPSLAPGRSLPGTFNLPRGPSGHLSIQVPNTRRPWGAKLAGPATGQFRVSSAQSRPRYVGPIMARATLKCKDLDGLQLRGRPSNGPSASMPQGHRAGTGLPTGWSKSADARTSLHSACGSLRRYQRPSGWRSVANRALPVSLAQRVRRRRAIRPISPNAARMKDEGSGIIARRKPTPIPFVADGLKELRNEDGKLSLPLPHEPPRMPREEPINASLN
jgi:hypothetical protein